MKFISGFPVAALAASALVATTLVTAPAQAHPTGDRAVEAGASWLTGQLTNGLVYNDQFGGFTDYGLSADFAFALREVGKDTATTAIVAALEPNADSWVGDSTPGGRVYAGSLAKMVSLVQASGKNPTAFNGADQVTRLEGLVSSTALLSGRLEDAGVTGDPWDADFVNVIGQSFASRALTVAGSARAADATSFLLDQQCNAGFFRATLTSDKTSANQGCVSGTDTGSVDTTALTIINILDTPNASTTAKGAAALAASWLRTQQAADGSFSAGGVEGDNANSTGLAGWALAKADDTISATKAARWLRGVQIADFAPCTTTLAVDNGGLAYQPGILAAARTTGITPGARDQYRRATAQSLPALANVPAGSGPLAITAPTTAVEKSSVTVTVTGLGAGEAGCVSSGPLAKSVVGTGADVTLTFDLPAGAAARTFTLNTLAGAQQVVVNATLAPVPAPPVAPVPATPETGAIVIPKVARVVKAQKNKFRLAVTCESTEACDGKIVVRTLGKVKLANGKTRRMVVARKNYSVGPGTTDKIVLKVRKPAREALGAKRLRVKAVQSAPGATRSVTKFGLRAVRG